MPVPSNIRQVERPKNTVVVDSASGNNYPVRERSSTRYIPGGNPQPVNGKVIGHIVNGVYVPIKPKTAANGPDMLSYGSSALVKSVSPDIYEDLLNVYPYKDAATIMAIASLRVIKPGIKSSRMSTHYNRTFICKYYSNASISANSICTLYHKIGQDGAKRKDFFKRRMLRVADDHHIAIDGMLKQNTSKVNDLSAFSRKARVKGCKDVSVLYAYDIDEMDIVCGEVFPGNSIDSKSYPAFIRDNDIRKGIIIDDKGFPPSVIENELKQRPDLHFLTPLKRSDKRIKNNEMLNFEGVLEGISKRILFKKKQIKENRWLYSFKDTKKASEEEAGYLERAKKNNSFDAEDYAKKKELFGVIVFESDLDMDAKTTYLCYDERWLLELVFDRYKNDEDLDSTNVQNDFSVIGIEFINTISTMLTCRILKKAEAAHLLDKMTYGDLLDDLSSAWRRVDAPEDAKSDDTYWIHTLDCVFKELEALGLSKPVPKPEPKKRGRPRKVKTEPDKPKRPRGRPRKNPIPDDNSGL